MPSQGTEVCNEFFSLNICILKLRNNLLDFNLKVIGFYIFIYDIYFLLQNEEDSDADKENIVENDNYGASQSLPVS